MNAETEHESGQFDVAKLGLAIIVMIAGIGGFYIYADQSLLLRVIGLLVMLSIAVVLVYKTTLGQSFWHFAQGSRIELKKIVWPTKKETTQTTLIVMVMVLFVGILLWMFDGLLMWGIGLVTG
ncbi:MAG: preprotein translocase subunit SecE [Methylophilaceae bacterium]|jgi:preprotein translocase subunit SecE|nr:preprotein translocase subunit SecE [Cycloclasticus sp.]HIL92418.1 preprotein translocase subunit SecE [Cycloclasticus sp.]